MDASLDLEIPRPHKLGAGAFAKYEALGNDYLVIDAASWGPAITPQQARALCHRNLGIGSDGLLSYEGFVAGRHRVKIINPDGSVAERSGNGLRIFARFLYDFGYDLGPNLALATASGPADAQLLFAAGKVSAIRMQMGAARFGAAAVHAHGEPDPDTFKILLPVGSQEISLYCCSMGNPHAVCVVEALDIVDFRRLAPLIEQHPKFAQGTNVQFAQVINEGEVQILIWERGAHETAASGSSSCAVAAVLRRLRRIGSSVIMNMPGGRLDVAVADSFEVTMTGPAELICQGQNLLFS